MVILAITTALRAVCSLVPGISVLLGLRSLNPLLCNIRLRLRCAIIALAPLRYEKPPPAISIRARSLKFEYGGPLSSARGARAAASDRHEAAAAGHQERLAREAH